MDELLVFVNDRLVPRSQGVVSVWDAGFQHGDAVYEGIRVYGGKLFRLFEHLQRLYECAHALDIRIPMAIDEMAVAVARTVRANNLHDDTHIRLTATRGVKRLTGMDPMLALEPQATIVVIAEPKQPTLPKGGMSLITSSLRRSPPQCLDPKLHTCNQLGQIMAKMEANNAGADEALMLDMHGFVAETNSANVFIVKGTRVVTPTRNACMPGLTRDFVLELAAGLGYEAREDDISLPDVYRADEAFVCGTVCEIAPVTRVDGRRIGSGEPGHVTARISEEYLKVATTAGTPVDDLLNGTMRGGSPGGLPNAAESRGDKRRAGAAVREGLIQKLRERGADGYLVTKEANKRYLTGVNALMGNVFVTASKSYIVTQARHLAFMQAQCSDFTVVRGGWDTIAALCRELGLSSVCFEDDVLPVRAYETLITAGVPLTPSAGLLEGLRAVKTEAEIGAIRRACAIADAAFEHIRTVIRVGVTEDTIAAELDHHMRTHGASDTSFKTLVSSGARCYLPHAVATSKPLADGDFVLMDFGAVYQGYCSDITRTVAVGHADERQRRMYGLVQTAQQKALDAIRAGMLTGAADAVARDFIMAHAPVGCYDYGLGHGIGIEVHEEPFMRPGSSIELRAGHVVSVEPGIYIPDWGGIRIEDTVLVGRNGCETLTKATKDLLVL